MDTDRNLLFGVLALQADLLDSGRFAEACAAWAARKEIPLAELLVERGWITSADRADVDRLLERKLKKHGGDVQASLAGVAGDDVQRVLAGLDNPEIQQSLANLSRREGHVLLSSISPLPESRERYTLTRLHARGGIGQVWVARDRSLGRDVALKELRPEQAPNPALWARFLQEAQITGQLEHPGIVPVYELARQPDDDRPFYTMRFVKGRTLREATLAYHKKNRAGQAGPLDQQALLNAFLGVCNAVAYAHAKGVVHRDLKGSNVVVGDYGEVIVLDWGLAKVVGQAEESSDTPLVSQLTVAAGGETHQGQVLGTPGYMSPEQAEGRLDLIDQRTDTYGLGAILYEILTGRPPHEGKEPDERGSTKPSTAEVLKRIVSGPTPRARVAVPSVPAPLDAICARAMAKLRKDRYARAADLAEDVRRFLADEPVSAWREPWSVRGRRWVSRHRTGVTAAAAALLVTALCFGVATALLTAANDREREARRQAASQRDEARKQRDLADKQRKEAQVQRDEADKQRKEAQWQRDEANKQRLEVQKQRDLVQKQRDRAQANFKMAHDAVDRFYTRVSEDKLLNQPGLQPLRKDLLKMALDFYHEFVKREDKQAELQVDLARAYYRLGHITFAIDSRAKAIEHLEQARAIFDKLARENPKLPDLQRELGNVNNSLGILYTVMGKYDEANAAFGRARKVWAKNDGNRHGQATNHLTQGAFWQMAGQFDKAEAAYQQGLKILESLHKDHPNDPHYRMALAMNYTVLGMLHGDRRSWKEAESCLTKAENMYEQLARDYPRVILYQLGRSAGKLILGEFFRVNGRLPEARNTLEQALASAAKVADANPAVIEYQNALAAAHRKLGLTYQSLSQIDKAETAFCAAEKILLKLAKEHSAEKRFAEELAYNYENLGYLYNGKLRLEQAEEAFQKASAVWQELRGKPPGAAKYRRSLAWNYNQSAVVQTARGRWAEAEASHKKAIDLREQLLKEEPNNEAFQEDLAQSYHNLGYHFQVTNHPAKAQEYLSRAIALRSALAKRHPGNPDHVANLSQVTINLGNLHFQVGKYKEALEHADQAMAPLKSMTARFPQHAQSQQQLAAGRFLRGFALMKLARYQDALIQWDQALKFASGPERFTAQANRGISSAYLGDHARAIAEAKALAQTPKTPQGLNYDLACIYAVASAAVGKDVKLPKTDRAASAEKYAAHAVELLASLHSSGFFRNASVRAHLRADPDLDPIRSRADFRKLLAKLEEK